MTSPKLLKLSLDSSSVCQLSVKTCRVLQHKMMTIKRTSPRSRRPFAIRRNQPGNQIRQLKNNNCHTARRVFKTSSVSSQQRENIRVAVRVRPPNDAERVTSHRIVVEVEDEHVVVFDPKENLSAFYFHGKKQNNNTNFRRYKEAKFVFDRVFPPDSTNEDVFCATIKQNLDSLMEGFNCSIFAYGATGSGKTFTMLGSGTQNPGLTILTLTDLYERLQRIEDGYTTSVSISYLEVYNEMVRDLLNPNTTKPGGLNILEDENGVSVPGITTLTPEGQSHLLQLLSEGNSRRTQHPTDHNAESSRSHAVFQVHLTIRAKFEDAKRKVRSAKLVMVDLAGSERSSATRFNSDRSREGASINKSLLALGNCINALADGKKHVPYRDSKLTRLLKDSLGGNCKTIIIANVSPSSLSYDDTFNTLKYADRAKHIRVNVKKNEVLLSARVAEYVRVIQDLQGQVNTLTGQLDLYKSSCMCLSSVTPTPEGSEAGGGEGDEIVEEHVTTPPLDDVSMFRGVKRRYAELKDSLSLIDQKVEMKRAKLAEVEANVSFKSQDVVARLRRRLEQAERNRETYLKTSQEVEKVLDEAINSVPANAIAAVPLREVLRLNGAESQLEFFLKNRDKERELMKSEVTRAQGLLKRSMALVASIYQVSHLYNHTTRQQDLEYTAVRQDYLEVPRQVRWADEEEENTTLPELPPIVANLNTTFEIPMD